jgi:hypothetical protein
LTEWARVYATALAGGYLAVEPVAALVDDWVAVNVAGDVAQAVESESVQCLSAAEAVDVVVPAAA